MQPACRFRSTCCGPFPFVGLILLLVATGCRQESAGQAVAENGAPSAAQPEPRTSRPAPETATEAEEPDLEKLEADAEIVLASMKPEWRAMLAEAEAFDRKERVGWCVTCHMNIQDEVAGGKHEKEEISCVECHGASERHARDENNEIKPDQIFAREGGGGDRACIECHDCSRPKTAGAPRQACIDCHTAHKFPLEPEADAASTTK